MRSFILALILLSFSGTPVSAQNIAGSTDARESELELDAAVGVAAASEHPVSEVAAWNSAELSGALSLRWTDWGRADCTPFCGPLWTNRFGGRVDANARGFAFAGSADAPGDFDLQVEESSEFALWFLSVGQTFAYQQEGTFYRTFWRPHDDTMAAGFTVAGNMMSGVDETAGVEVGAIRLDWRTLWLRESVSPIEFTIDVALVDGLAETDSTWFERFGIGVVTFEHYGILVGRESDK